MSDSRSAVVAMNQINKACQHISTLLCNKIPELIVVCGSGLSGLSAALDKSSIFIIPYEGIPHFPRTSVEGHGDALVVGDMDGHFVGFLLGRFHYYEGYTMEQVVFPIRVMAKLGVKRLLFTNAAGALNPVFNVGDLMVIEDHISMPIMAGQSPLRGENLSEFGVRFPSVTSAYNPKSCTWCQRANVGNDFTVHRGVYAHVGGPTYETPSEVKSLRLLGGDAVGMSTVPEVITAVHAGLKVVAISSITNVAVVDSAGQKAPEHAEVLEEAQKRTGSLIRFIRELIAIYLTESA